MKKLTTMILLIASAFILSCEGPMGPPGIPGEDGDSLIGSIFEIEGDFTAGNQYQLFFDFPNKFEIYDTDVVLVYILWDVVKVNGVNTDVWRSLPQTLVFDQGILQYNFDYTVNDVRVFLETTLSSGELLPAETQDQVFRIAVLPADFVSMKSKSELNDMNLLLNAPEINLNLVKK
jgi:hypothetical protein